MKPFDSYEIEGCHVVGHQDGIDMVERCDIDKAEFYTLYGHTDGEGVQSIADFDTIAEAEEMYFKITGHQYEG